MKRLVSIVAALAVLALSANASAADWKGSFNASYQAAKPGDVISVPPGTISGDQVIAPRADLQNLPVPCAWPDQTGACIKFVTSGPTIVNGVLEIRGSSVWVAGGGQLRFNGYVDTEANSNATRPDGIIVEGTSSPNFGIFNAERVWFRNMDVGPATVSGANCGIREGRGMENKIGWGGSVTFVPKDIVLDGLHVHDQNGDKGRELGDCHYGGLFLVTVDGLTIKNSTFERNVIYSIQVQNFEGPPAKRVLLDHNSFSCAVAWLYQGAGCEQRPLQFDYPPGSEFTLRDNLSANGAAGLYGCIVGSCGGVDAQNRPLSVKARETGTIDFPDSTTAPPLTVTPPPPPPPPPACPGSTIALTKVAETATTVTLAWQPVSGATGYRFSRSDQARRSHTWDGNQSTVKFGKIPGGGCYRVEALGVLASGGAAG